MLITSMTNVNQGIFNIDDKNQTKIAEDKTQLNSEEKDFVVEISPEAKKKLKEEEKAKEAKAKMEEAKRLLEQLEEQKEAADAAKEGMEDLGKILEIARRIANGDKVPQSDEKKLMEYSNDLYQAVKAAAILNANKKHKEYDSLFEDEENDVKEKARALDREQSAQSNGESESAESRAEIVVESPSE